MGEKSLIHTGNSFLVSDVTTAGTISSAQPLSPTTFTNYKYEGQFKYIIDKTGLWLRINLTFSNFKYRPLFSQDAQATYPVIQLGLLVDLLDGRC